MQSYEASVKDANITIISPSPEVTHTSSSKLKSCKQPLSIDEETIPVLDDESNSDEKKGGEVGNIPETQQFVMGGVQLQKSHQGSSELSQRSPELRQRSQNTSLPVHK